MCSSCFRLGIGTLSCLGLCCQYSFSSVLLLLVCLYVVCVCFLGLALCRSLGLFRAFLVWFGLSMSFLRCRLLCS